MMMGRLPAALCVLLLIAAPGAFGQDDFDLGAALDDAKKPTEKPTKKPEPAQPGGGNTEFDLDEALGGGGVVEKKPTVKPQPAQPGIGGGGDELDLGDAIGGDADKKPTEKPKPAQPGQGGGTGSFGDDDLFDAAGGMPPHNPSGGDSRPHAGGEEGGQGQGEEKQSVIAGVVSALGVAAVGAISSFIAYQKKKLCFKGQAEDDPENVNMDNQKGDQHDPQAQSSLLAK